MDAEERRLRVRKRRAERERKTNQDLYPGINDFSDALEAMPLEIVRHFTLLREIDAKCIVTMPPLKVAIERFFQYPVITEDVSIQRARAECLETIRRLIRDLMPCQEEKMHVAGVAAEAVARHVSRLDFDFDMIAHNEIPDLVRFGPVDHPAIMSDSRQSDALKNAQTTRSETRREAIAAKKAAQAAATEKRGLGGSLQGTSISANGRSMPTNGSTRSKPGPKPKQKPGTPQLSNAILAGSNGGSKRRRNEDDEEDGNVSRPDTPGGGGGGGSKRSRQRGATAGRSKDEDSRVYCYCQQVSFGEMVGCDGADCKLEWFHLPCIGLTSPPKGQWYCDECASKRKKSTRV